MSTEVQKTALLEVFQQYLEGSPAEPFATREQPDLHTLLCEIASLKTEVKGTSRQFKNTLETLGSALESVQEENKNLAAQLAARSERSALQQADTMRVLLLDMIELYDHLGAGVEVIEKYRPVNALFKHSQKKDVRFIERFKEGQQMTHRRFTQLLHTHQVTPIKCLGELLNPVTMIAVATEKNPKFDHGKVLEELRPGFLYQGQVLRLAQVKVNQITTG